MESSLQAAEKRNMLRTLPPVVKLHAMDRVVRCRPGKEVSCRLRLERTTNFPGPLDVRLAESSRESGFVAEPVRFAAGVSEAVISARAPAGIKPGETIRLTFRGTGRLNDAIEITTQIVVECRVN